MLYLLNGLTQGKLHKFMKQKPDLISATILKWICLDWQNSFKNQPIKLYLNFLN